MAINIYFDTFSVSCKEPDVIWHLRGLHIHHHIKKRVLYICRFNLLKTGGTYTQRVVPDKKYGTLILLARMKLPTQGTEIPVEYVTVTVTDRQTSPKHL
jgi:hypothetical protein